MSLYAAMTVAVGGLAAQSASISNISDNLANSQTTGYKGVETKFEALVTQSNVFNNDPGGVKATPYYTNSVQGNLASNSSATALAISGSGYFPVRAAVVGADGTTTFGGTTYFTRAGDFTLNSGGYLVNNGGYYLTGYTVSSTSIVDTSSSDPIKLAELLDNPVATSTIEYAANLPSNALNNQTYAPSTIEIYDSLGGSHDLSFTWTKTDTNTWDLNVTVPDGVATAAPVVTIANINTTLTTANSYLAQIQTLNGQIAADIILGNPTAADEAARAVLVTQLDGIVAVTTTDNGDGTIDVTTDTGTDLLTGASMAVLSFDGTDITDAAAPAVSLNTVLTGGTLETQLDTYNGPAVIYSAYTATIPFTFNDVANAGTISAIGASASVPPDWTLVTNIAGDALVNIDLDYEGAGTETITIDFGRYDSSTGVTQFADQTISVSTLEQNGIPRGSFQSLSIDENGFVALNYDNGRTRIISQIPVVQFFAEGQLQRVTGGAFSQTLTSGSARYGVPGTNGGGSIQSYALEGSNVDIADQFTKLITAQQVYSANAKTITTANNMMEQAINIIR